MASLHPKKSTLKSGNSQVDEKGSVPKSDVCPTNWELGERKGKVSKKFYLLRLIFYVDFLLLPFGD